MTGSFVHLLYTRGVARAKARVALRVRLVVTLLKLLGKPREANKLQIGFRQCEFTLSWLPCD